jgi:hypothetical protein
VVLGLFKSPGHISNTIHTISMGWNFGAFILWNFTSDFSLYSRLARVILTLGFFSGEPWAGDHSGGGVWLCCGKVWLTSALRSKVLCSVCLWVPTFVEQWQGEEFVQPSLEGRVGGPEGGFGLCEAEIKAPRTCPTWWRWFTGVCGKYLRWKSFWNRSFGHKAQNSGDSTC